MKENILIVRHYGQEVGQIQRDNSGLLFFSYAESWISQGGFALATSLPLRPGRQETTYFANLLPEADSRKRIAKAAGISANNNFALLQKFGADCAGSLQITDPEFREQPGASGDKVLLLSEADGKKLATKSGFAHYFRPETRVRLSLAGAQNKLAVVKTPQGLAVPLDGQASTHILKLPNPDYKGLVENEALMLSLAAALGLPVVEHEIVKLGTTKMLLLKRYDREQNRNDFSLVEMPQGSVMRLHQQDICQSLGLPPDIKYESEGGPALKDVFEIVRQEVDDPLAATQKLLNWVVFNVLIHNADAHAKNVSLLRTLEGKQELAPFYDLVCTGAYPLDHRMAMSIGGQFDPGVIGKKNWLALAANIGIGKSLVLKTLGNMAKRMPAVLETEIQKFETQLASLPRRQQIERTILKRVKKTLDFLS